MKPCFRNRKRIALLVAQALDAREAAAVREHLALCEGCRHSWEEMSAVAHRLASAPPCEEVEASESFHRGVAEKLRVSQAGSVLESLTAWCRGLVQDPRVAVPAVATLVIALVVMVRLRPAPEPSPPLRRLAPAWSVSSSQVDLAPTIANYQRVANESLEKLEQLLTAQGNRRLPPAPIYTAWGLGPVHESF